MIALVRRFTVLLMLVMVLPLAVSAAPQRIVSVNLCTDQLLMLIAKPEQIVSVSVLSTQQDSSFLFADAQQYLINYGNAEELLTLQPDLVVASSYTPPSLTQLMVRLGVPVVQFEPSASVADIRDRIRQMAEITGNQATGEQLIASMDQRLLVVQRQADAQSPGALFYQPRGYTSGNNTLQDDALRLAGWRNVSSEMGVEGYAPIDLEKLLMSRPDQLFTSRYGASQDSVGQRMLTHPVLRRVVGDRPMINISYKYWICGGPMIVDAIAALSELHPIKAVR